MSAPRITRRMLAASVVAVPLVVSAYMRFSPVDQVRWMAGCWEAGSAHMLIEEHWMEPRGGTMLGMSRTTRGDSTITYEWMRISERGERLVFTAHPSGQAAAEFTSTARAPTEVVFTNPEHDFPQTIRYRRVGADSLIARIEGTRGGELQGMDFPMARVACPAGRDRMASP